mmetsp:Transcript_17912/g.47755  ORF Transcript_17912/g.47755 Transcript_17912/m.47755 type:complete len:204 (+) Transcript_17912:1-612(+)
MVVGLHDVDLRAPLAADHVRITIVWGLPLPVGTRAGLPLHVACRHGDEVEGQVAGAADFAQVHPVADDFPQQLELLDVLWLPSLLLVCKDCETGVVVDGHGIAINVPACACQVCRLHTTDFDLAFHKRWSFGCHGLGRGGRAPSRSRSGSVPGGSRGAPTGCLGGMDTTAGELRFTFAAPAWTAQGPFSSRELVLEAALETDP